MESLKEKNEAKGRKHITITKKKKPELIYRKGLQSKLENCPTTINSDYIFLKLLAFKTKEKFLQISK